MLKYEDQNRKPDDPRLKGVLTTAGRPSGWMSGVGSQMTEVGRRMTGVGSQMKEVRSLVTDY